MSPSEFQAYIGADDQQVCAISAFRSLVVTWNHRMNLVGPSFETDFWRRHALDCAQLFHVEQSAKRWGDIGSGAGFPGIVLAILLKKRDGTVHLVESQAKKIAFLREVCAELNLPVVIHHTRAEAIKEAPAVDVVTARACAPLPRLMNYAAAFFMNGARGVFLKGTSVDDEIRAARNDWDFECVAVDSLSAPEGRILRIDKVRRRA